MIGVLGMARLLEDMNLDFEQRECVDTIVSSGEALLTIIDDLLDVSKLEAGKLELERIPFVLEDVVAQPNPSCSFIFCKSSEYAEL